MEIKLVISVDEKTADLVKGLTEALVFRGSNNATVQGVAKPDVVAVETAEEPVVKKKSSKKSKETEKEVDKTEEVEETTEEPEITVDDLRRELAEAKHRVGSIEPCKKIIAKYGAKGVSDVDPADYKAMMKDLRALGN